MTYVARDDRPADKAERYAEVEQEILAVLEGEPDRVARMATVSSMLADAFPAFFWTGFYVVDPGKGDELVVGPYQGTLGCLRIPFGRGVCGAAAASRTTQVVEDVHAFPGHIACDSRSASEIVVPVLDREGRLIAVFDVDATEVGAFDAVDAQALERLMGKVFAAWSSAKPSLTQEDAMADRVIVVTGGQGALGRAVVQAARADGLQVAVIDHAPAGPATAEVFEQGGVDLTDAGAAAAALDAVAARFGRLDALLNVAGGFVWQTVDDAEPAWERMHAMNLVTALNATRAALPHLKRSDAGRIVNVGAAGAVRAAAGMGAYAASKAGVHRLTESLAEELKATSVTVNAVLPSILDTEQNRRDMPDADPAAWVQPADLARVMLFLASPESRAMTGALVPVTGRV